MSELPTHDELEAIHVDVSEIYSTPEIIQQIRAARAISQEATRPKRPVTTIIVPHLFGEWSKPEAPELPPNDD